MSGAPSAVPSAQIAPPSHPDQAAQAAGECLRGSPAETDSQKYNQAVLDSIAEEDPSGANLKGYKHEAIKSMQQALKDKGLYHDKVDGIAGPHTKEALLAYGHSHGAPQPATAPATPAAAPIAQTPVSPYPQPYHMHPHDVVRQEHYYPGYGYSVERREQVW